MSARLPLSILTNVEKQPNAAGMFHWVVMIDGRLRDEGYSPSRPVAQERVVQWIANYFREAMAGRPSPSSEDAVG